MRIRLSIAILLAATLGGCAKQDAEDQNVAIDINNADPADIEAVPSDETAAETADANADLANAN